MWDWGCIGCGIRGVDRLGRWSWGSGCVVVGLRRQMAGMEAIWILSSAVPPAAGDSGSCDHS